MLIEWMSFSVSHKDLFLDFTSYINQWPEKTEI